MTAEDFTAFSKIELCVINISKQKRFTEKSSQPYYSIIKELITKSLDRNKMAVPAINEIAPASFGEKDATLHHGTTKIGG